MLSAIAETAVMEAAHKGGYWAAFHGFHIHARRWATPLGYYVAVEVIDGGTLNPQAVLAMPACADQYDGERMPARHGGVYFCATVVESIAMLPVL